MCESNDESHKSEPLSHYAAHMAETTTDLSSSAIDNLIEASVVEFPDAPDVPDVPDIPEVPGADHSWDPAPPKGVSVSAETVQERGRKGVQRMKAWLESTTRFAFTFTVYDHAESCTITCMDGSGKRLDIVGKYLTKDVPVYVECKKYSSPGAQAEEYAKFLAIAFSATERSVALYGEDPKTHFLWVTTHPFAQSKWPRLTTVAYLKECVEAEPSLRPVGKPIDLDLLSSVGERIWVLITGDKQMKLRMSDEELDDVRSALLKRKRK